MEGHNNNNKLYLYHGQRGSMTVHIHTFAHALTFLPLDLVSLVRLFARSKSARARPPNTAPRF